MKRKTKQNRVQLLVDKLKNYQKYLLFFLCIVFALSLARNIAKIKNAQVRVERIKERVEKLQKEKEELQLKVEEAKKQEYIEKQLRDKLGLSKEGETIVVLPDADTLRKLVPPIPEEEETLPDPNWKKWLKVFDIVI